MPSFVLLKQNTTANLEKLTALSEEAVELVSSNYSPYSKV